MANQRGVLAHAAGEHQRIHATQHGGERADLPGGALHEVVDRQLRARFTARQQRAHVATEARQPEQTRLPIEQSLQLFKTHAAFSRQIEQHTGVDRAATTAHRQAIERRKTHGRIDAAARPQRTEAGTAAEVGDDHAPPGNGRCHLMQPVGDVLAREAMKAVTAHASHIMLPRQCVEVGQL